MKISVAQTHPTDGPRTFSPEATASPEFDVFANIRQNLVGVTRAVEAASDSGSSLVVFPEYFTQGSLDGRGHLAQPAHYILQELIKLAIRFKIAIAGTIVEPEYSTYPEGSPFSPEDDSTSTQTTWNVFIRQSHPDAFGTAQPPSHDRSSDNKDLPEDDQQSGQPQRLLNVAYFIEGGTGKVIGRYVKKNLWISEREYLHPGSDDHAVFRWGDISVGFLICWDLAHPLAAQSLAKQGADLIIAPTYWLSTDSEPSITKYDPPADYEYQLLQALAYSRAFETETALIMCNAGGSQTLMGGSGIWVPFKGKLAGKAITSKDQDSSTDLRLYEVDLGLLPVARKTYKIREDWENAAAVLGEGSSAEST